MIFCIKGKFLVRIFISDAFSRYIFDFEGERFDKMTPKELLYLEDSLGMEQQLITKCNDYSGKVTDQQLKNTLTQLAAQHQQHYDSLLAQLSR